MLQQLFTEIRQTPLLEWIGVGFGVAQVLLARANKIWLYPCGIISVAVSIYIFYQAGLFAESGLNVYYLVMSFYGWWLWIKRKGQPPLQVGWSTKREWLITAGIVVLGFVLLYLILAHFTSSTVPAWDAWVSATAWAGMWLLARRRIENWVLLNISNLFAIPLLFHKGLPLYGLLTIFLFIVAILGYLEWRKILKQQNQSAPSGGFDV